MPKFNFENIHKNHKFAFLDGMLCGITIAIIAKGFYDDYAEAREEKRLLKEETERIDTMLNNK